MYQYSFISCDKFTILIYGISNKGNWAMAIWELLYLQLFCKLKIILKFKTNLLTER